MGRHMITAEPMFTRVTHPIDLFEYIASSNDWTFERTSEDDITLSIPGNWSDYHLSITWRDDLESMHLACAFDLKVHPARVQEMYRLLARINEQLWLGHFDFWSAEGVLLYRQSLILNAAEPTVQQFETMTQTAVEACERYYQAFQFVVWAGKKAEDALAGTMFETVGQA